jgi:hypothetical protein
VETVATGAISVSRGESVIFREVLSAPENEKSTVNAVLCRRFTAHAVFSGGVQIHSPRPFLPVHTPRPPASRCLSHSAIFFLPLSIAFAGESTPWHLLAGPTRVPVLRKPGSRAH